LTWDREADVVVLGSGGAGLTAALTAAVNGANVELFEAAATVGGTTAVSAGILWVPANERCPGVALSLDDALLFLRASAWGTLDSELVETFVRTAPELLDFLEEQTSLRFVAIDRGDWEPELPGAKASGRSFTVAPVDQAELGAWAHRLTVFDSTFGGPGFDIRTGASSGGRGGALLVSGLLKAVLDRGVEPRVNSRGVRLIGDGAGGVLGVHVDGPYGREEVRARRGVILATGGFEWDDALTTAFLPAAVHGATSPPTVRGDGLRMAMAVGADLAHMTEARFLPVMQIPGLAADARLRSWTGLFDLAGPRSVIVNRAGCRFVNEAGGRLAEALSDRDPVGGVTNDPAFLVFDSGYLKCNGAFDLTPGQPVPDLADVSPELAPYAAGYAQRVDQRVDEELDPLWFWESEDLLALAARIGVDPAGLGATVERWNRAVGLSADPEFGREAAPEGRLRLGHGSATSRPTMGPIDTPPYYAVSLRVGVIGTRGGPRTDRDGRVLHVFGHPIPGLFAAGNAACSALGGALPAPGCTLSPQMVSGLRAGYAAATGGPFVRDR
jgi:succinate dehydrogenase/fumarate reductase flavoprotein subunit